MATNETSHLYNAADTAKVREKLYKEQLGIDKLTKLPINYKDAVLDHSHKTQFVRGVIHRQANAVLGKIENLWTRYLKFWYNGTLSEFLRHAASYLEQKDDTRYLHPGWIKAMHTRFRALDEKSKNQVLHNMALTQGNNSKERFELFRKALLSRQFTMTQIESIIQKVKDSK